jgi:hypothetical protein
LVAFSIQTLFTHQPTPVSGEPVQDPVITKDGIIFERRLIEKYIATNGTCPITKNPLTKEDLITVKCKPFFIRSQNFSPLCSLLLSSPISFDLY